MKATQIAAITGAICAVASGTVRAQNPGPGIDDFLRSTGIVDASTIAAAQQGATVTRLLHTDIGRDVAVLGIIGIHTTREAYTTRMRDMQALIASRPERSGMISDPVRDDELQGVFFDGSEWRDLENCDVNDCAFKMPLSLMRQFAQSVDWEGSGAQREADSVMRSAMVDLVTAYRARGNAALLRYDDTNGVQAADAFSALIGQSQFLRQYAPAFRDFIDAYPANRPDSAADAIYWSMYRIPHLRSTFTVNQIFAYTTPSGTPLVARKQLYADHYFESSLEVSAVFDAPNLAGGPGIYLVTVQRFRFDNLPGGLFNIRGRVRSQLQKLMKTDLERERKAVEGTSAS
jgi:hypothetical protein